MFVTIILNVNITYEKYILFFYFCKDMVFLLILLQEWLQQILNNSIRHLLWCSMKWAITASTAYISKESYISINFFLYGVEMFIKNFCLGKYMKYKFAKCCLYIKYLACRRIMNLLLKNRKENVMTAFFYMLYYHLNGTKLALHCLPDNTFWVSFLKLSQCFVSDTNIAYFYL